MPAVRRSGFTWDLILLSVLAQNVRALCTGELRPGNLEHPEWNSTKLSVMDLSVCAQSLTLDRTAQTKKRMCGGRICCALDPSGQLRQLTMTPS
jgi:hypothetical protein